ncbi:MAG: hypothetical protein WCI64_11135 [Chlorobium sp.]
MAQDSGKKIVGRSDGQKIPSTTGRIAGGDAQDTAEKMLIRRCY